MRRLVSAKCDACDRRGSQEEGPVVELSIKFDTDRVPTFWIQLCVDCLKSALAELDTTKKKDTA